jgi:hypothetical protein
MHPAVINHPVPHITAEKIAARVMQIKQQAQRAWLGKT